MLGCHSKFVSVDVEVDYESEINKFAGVGGFVDYVGRLRGTLDLIKELGLPGVTSESEILCLEGILQAVFTEFDGVLDTSAAIAFGVDFAWPKDVGASTAAAFRSANYSITKLAEKFFIESEPFRVNAVRVKALRQLDLQPGDEDLADWKRLCDMAMDGIDIYTPPTFVRRAVRRPLRELYKSVTGAVNYVMQKDCEANLGFLLKDEDLKRSKELIHHSPMHWVPKQGTPEGRAIADMSGAAEGEDALNSDEVRAHGKDIYGTLRHPTISDYVAMIWTARQHYQHDLARGSRLAFFQTDLNQAFKKLPIRPSSVSKTALDLDNGLVLFYVAGFFGWCLFPYCFGVVTRLLVRLALISSLLFVLGYVDDFTGITLEELSPKECATFVDICERMLGGGAVNLGKTIPACRKLVVIGWEIDLDGGEFCADGHAAGTISMSPRNLRKIFHGFFSVPADWQLRLG